MYVHFTISLFLLSVYLSCHNRTPETAWLIHSKHLFLTVLEAGKSKIKVPAHLVTGESLLPGS